MVGSWHIFIMRWLYFDTYVPVSRQAPTFLSIYFVWSLQRLSSFRKNRRSYVLAANFTETKSRIRSKLSYVSWLANNTIIQNDCRITAKLLQILYCTINIKILLVYCYLNIYSSISYLRSIYISYRTLQFWDISCYACSFQS